MLYKKAPEAYNIENDVIQKTQPKNTDFSPKKHVIHFEQDQKEKKNARTTERMKLEVYLLLNDAVIKLYGIEPKIPFFVLSLIDLIRFAIISLQISSCIKNFSSFSICLWVSKVQKRNHTTIPVAATP